MADDRTSSAGFYEGLNSFSDFAEFSNPEHFSRVPGDWFVVVADVAGSTGAIEAGRYKDVNTIGAACISVVQEALQLEIPFVFGGDGATLVVPPDRVAEAMKALEGLQWLARKRFALELRVGSVRVDEVCSGETMIEVARHELNSGRCLAVFRGGGLSEAEARIKARVSNTDDSVEEPEGGTELRGLSCRWNPIPSKRGCVMSLLVLSREPGAPGAYREILEELNRLLDGKLEQSSPVHPETMTYKSMARLIEDERRYHSNPWSFSFLTRLAEIMFAVLVFKWRLPPLIFNPSQYLHSMGLHSDYRKFDDMLRMIIDTTPAQADAIEASLERARTDGKVHYGMHRSESALMTCYVREVNDGGHIHFIDGGDGGYAMASKQLKEQVKGTSP